MKRFVIGDIHGGYRALMQCFEKSGFNPAEDSLVVLGDVVDGWPDTRQVVDELLKCKHVIPILGNHDKWFMEWVDTGYAAPVWTSQGGLATINSYIEDAKVSNIGTYPQAPKEARDHVVAYFSKCHPWYLDETNNIYVHGGFNWTKPIDEQLTEELLWDRHMYEVAFMWKYRNNPYKFGDYNTVFIGHTTTQYSPIHSVKGSLEPFMYSNLINLDTGGGWSGKLTIMDVDSKEYWQSDLVPELYPEIEGRI